MNYPTPRVVLTPPACRISTLRLEILPTFQTFCWISTLQLEILPEIWLHLSQNLTDFQENWLTVNSLSGAGIPEILKCNHSYTKPSALIHHFPKRTPGHPAVLKVSSPLGPPASTQNPTKIQQKLNRPNTAEKKASRPQVDVQRVPTWTPNAPTTSEIEVRSRSWRGIW